MIKEEFATVVLRLRKKCKKTQKQISLESGLSMRFVQEIEAGQKQPTITSLFYLAAALDTTPDKLVLSVWKNWVDAGQPDE